MLDWRRQPAPRGLLVDRKAPRDQGAPHFSIQSTFETDISHSIGTQTRRLDSSGGAGDPIGIGSRQSDGSLPEGDGTNGINGVVTAKRRCESVSRLRNVEWTPTMPGSS